MESSCSVISTELLHAWDPLTSAEQQIQTSPGTTQQSRGFQTQTSASSSAGAAGMPDKMSWHKGKKELTEESSGEAKHGRKKREQLFKKRFARLSLFSGSPKNKLHTRLMPESCMLKLLPQWEYSPQGRSPPAEDKRRRWHRRGCRRQEEPCSLPQLGAPRRSGRMCPSCEILLCRPCGTLHSQRAFIAHSLLDHYDSAALPR